MGDFSNKKIASYPIYEEKRYVDARKEIGTIGDELFQLNCNFASISAPRGISSSGDNRDMAQRYLPEYSTAPLTAEELELMDYNIANLRHAIDRFEARVNDLASPAKERNTPSPKVEQMSWLQRISNSFNFLSATDR
tara:strand:+ start:90 stop:500 length:411 start_codon:yes stop_codon:yes gene_type:complete